MAVHPRMRGERLLLKVGGVERHGSSPHARGTRRAARRPVAAGRFIPACAGNAGACAWWRPPQPVHPRMRGERSPSEFPLSHRYGSSPHARGTHGCQQIDKGGRRFIPACAGNATSSAASRALASVHPRMRGERRAERGRTGSLGCSSPHARGTLSLYALRHSSIRFIPACAGNALFVTMDSSINTVHPRMRGERGAAARAMVDLIGSSPHARGTHFQ